MVICFHQIVDAVGVFMALCGQMQIDHSGVQTAMAQVLLDTADIDPPEADLQQMGGIAVAQGVGGDAFFDSSCKKGLTDFIRKPFASKWPFDAFDWLSAGRLKTNWKLKGLRNLYVSLLISNWLGDQDSNLS